jgi:WD40 repeat protein/serine/threonine protein kinase/Flp pilus assembly protein TadD
MTDSSGDRDPIEVLAEEFLARKRRGEKPTLSEYTDKYPHLAADIRELFPALLMMEDLGASSLATTGPPLVSAPAVRQLGEYRILREVGRGGMGVVYEAEQQSLGRRVALKVLPPHALNDAQQVVRFEREARAAAKLHHTNIVPVFGVGHQDATHYYVMQFIQGLGLDGVLEELRRVRTDKTPEPTTAALPQSHELVGAAAHASPESPSHMRQVAHSLLTDSFHWNGPSSGADGQAGRSTVTGGASEPAVPRLPDGSDLSSVSGSDSRYWRSVARIGVQVAEALEYAHGQGIFHRDIKPSNLLMDMKGTVWVTDFGLAKAGDSKDLTHTGDVVGTVRYMAPERFQGRSDARSDVYSLGLTLYELLALRPAFDQRDRAKLIQQVLHDEPPRLRKLNRAVPRDLETIIQKAIAKEPERRYLRAADLAADLKRFLDDRPIQARRVSGAERLWRWCRRKPALASAVLLAATALVAVTVVSSLFAYHQRRANQQLSDAYADLNDNQEKLTDEQGKTLQEKRNTVEALNKSRRLSVMLAAERSRVLVEQKDPNHALLWLTKALETAPDDAGDLQFQLRCNLAGLYARHSTPVAPPPPVVATSPSVLLLQHGEQIVAQSPDGGRTVIIEQQANSTPPWKYKAFRLVDATTGKQIGEPLPLAEGHLRAVFTPDGKRFATVWQKELQTGKGEFRLWDPATAQPLTPARECPILGSVFLPAPDGKRFLTGHAGGQVRFWDVDTGEQRPIVLDHKLPATARIERTVCSADGSRIVTACRDEARLWDMTTGAAIGEAMRHEGGLHLIVFSPDGKFLATGGEDGAARLWNTATGKLVGRPLQHAHRLVRILFSPDGQILATWAIRSGLDRANQHEARLWRTRDGEPLGPVFQPDGYPTLLYSAGGFSFSPDGLLLLTAADRTVQIWDVETSKQLDERPAVASFASADIKKPLATFSDDGLSVITQAGTWQLDTAAPLPHILPHRDLVTAVAFSPDGTRLITGTQSVATNGGIRSAYLWDRATGQPMGEPMPHADRITIVAFSPDGQLVLTGASAWDGTAQLWDGHTGKRYGPPMQYGFGSAIEVGAFSKNGTTILLGGYAKEHLQTARMWDVRTGQRVGAPLVHQKEVKTLAYSPDGTRILTGSSDKTAQLWDAHTGKPIGTPMTHDDAVESVTFSPDGSLVLTASKDKTARLWNGFTGAPVRTLKHEDGVTQALFSPTSKTIFTASHDKTGRLWDVETGQAIGLPWQHPAALLSAAFSPDGKVVVTGCEDGKARLWAAEAGQELSRPLPHPRPVTSVVFSPDGRSVATICGDHAVRLWDVPRPVTGSARRLVLWVQVETGKELDPQGGVHTLDEAVLAQRCRELDDAGGPPVIAENSPERLAERHYRIAQRCALLGNWQAVVWHTERTLKERPRDWPVWLLLGQARYNLGQVDEAGAAYDRAFALGPTPSVLSACALHMDSYEGEEFEGFRHRRDDPSVMEKRNRAAVWYLNRMIAHESKDWQLFDRRGWAYGDLGEDDKAEEDYRRAVALGPDASFFYREQGATEEATGWALRHLARKKWDAAAQDYARLIELRKDDLSVWQLHALFCLYKGDTAGYRRACNELLGRAREDWRWMALAWVGETCGYGVDATANIWTPIPWLERAVQDREWGLRFRSSLGTAYYRAGRLKEAVACLTECASDARPQPDAWLVLTMAHRRLGHAEESEKWRAKTAAWITQQSQPASPGQFTRDRPDLASALLQALVLRRELESLEKSDAQTLAALNLAVAMWPAEPELLLQRGRFYANRGQWDKAAADFTSVVDAWPKEVGSWLARGQFSIQRGHDDEAVADFTKAISLRPEDAELRLSCARARLLAHDWKGAAEDFRRVAVSRPDDVAMRVQCGEAEATAGDWKRAVEDFTVATEKQPDEIRHWHYLALAQLGAGDRAGYRTTCAAMKQRFLQAPNGNTISTLLYTCALTADTDADMPGFAALAPKFGITYREWARETGGAVFFRAGKFPEAVRCLNNRVLTKDLRASEYLFLAMAHQRLGNIPEANDNLTKAETWMAVADKQDCAPLGGARTAWPSWRDRLIAHVLHQQAAAMIQGDKTADDKEPR